MMQSRPEDQREVVTWHALTADEAVRALRTDPEDGLSGEEAGGRLAEYGPNLLKEFKRKPAVLRFLAQFNDFMIWVLLAAVVISGALLREYIDAAVIMVIVLLNAVLGFAQESRAEQAMRALKKMSAPTAKVIRLGAEEIVPAGELVRGDVIVVEAGDLVSADSRLLTSANLRTDESSLTGESVAAEKDAGASVEPEAGVGDRANMVFAGTHVEYGRGTAVVVETGHSTQVGQIARLLEESEAGSTPLQLELRNVGKRVVYICIAIVVIVFAVGMARGNDFAIMLLFAVSLAVAAIPEGLPAIVTITLALGTQAMARLNAIVRNLPAVETLGSADYICSDKTGTLTLNRMTVTDVMFGDSSCYLFEDAREAADFRATALSTMLIGAALCNDARRGAGGGFIGDSTEVAILAAAEASGFQKTRLDHECPRIAEIPFDSDRKMMTTVHREDGGFVVYSKGAAEAVVERCTRVLGPGGEEALSDAARRSILTHTAELGSQTLRTLAMACKRLSDDPGVAGSLESDLVFVGALAMKDPPRREAFHALDTCRKARIRVAMITGDHRATAEAVARELDILRPGLRLLEGRDLERMSPEVLVSQVEDIGVYARVSPGHKVKIVEALKARGHVVAMTGDGVNDAPALKRADIGVAMGIAGTDVAKEASDMVLADDNFATIVAAVRQGRVIFNNLKKFIYFLLSCNISEVLTMFIAMVVGFPLPLVPAQVLWINLVTDGLPALALGVDPPEPDVMERPPRIPGENILSLPRQRRLLWQGLLITAGALAAFILSRYLLGYNWSDTAVGGGLDASRTVLFTTMVLSQLFHSFNLRSETRSLFASPPWENTALVGAFLISVGLQMAVLYLPFMHRAFHTQAPSLSAWILIFLCALIPVLLIDRIKVLLARRSGEPGS
jgi:Ca2+-transporting ATPase